MRETAIHKLTHGTHPLLGNEEGKHSMSQERGEVWKPTARGTPREPGFNEMRPFGEAKSISGHQTLQLMRRPYGGKRVRCHTPCLPKVPRGRARRSRATTRERIPPPAGGTGDGHLKAHHDLQATPARPGKATRLGVRGSIVPAAPRTSYSSFLKAGGRDLFSATEKNGADFTRHNLTMHPIPMICA